MAARERGPDEHVKSAQTLGCNGSPSTEKGDILGNILFEPHIFYIALFFQVFI
jgi:hypothetical protein